MRFCKLKNKSTVPLAVVITSMISIKSLYNSNNSNKKQAVYELGKIAQDPKHKISSPEKAKVLKDFVLLQQDNTLHGWVRDIAQSAISFDEKDMTLLGEPVVGIFEAQV